MGYVWRLTFSNVKMSKFQCSFLTAPPSYIGQSHLKSNNQRLTIKINSLSLSYCSSHQNVQHLSANQMVQVRQNEDVDVRQKPIARSHTLRKMIQRVEDDHQKALSPQRKQLKKQANRFNWTRFKQRKNNLSLQLDFPFIHFRTVLFGVQFENFLFCFPFRIFRSTKFS